MWNREECEWDLWKVTDVCKGCVTLKRGFWSVAEPDVSCLLHHSLATWAVYSQPHHPHLQNEADVSLSGFRGDGERLAPRLVHSPANTMNNSHD